MGGVGEHRARHERAKSSTKKQQKKRVKEREEKEIRAQPATVKTR